MALLALVEETKEKMRLKKSAKNGSLIKNRVVFKKQYRKIF